MYLTNPRKPTNLYRPGNSFLVSQVDKRIVSFGFNNLEISTAISPPKLTPKPYILQLHLCFQLI